MKIHWPSIAGWCRAVLLTALPWWAWWDPRWAPLLAGGAVLIHTRARRSRAIEPWATVVVAVSAAAFVLVTAGWRGPIWFWLALVVVVGAAARFIPGGDGGRPDTADLLAVVCWASSFAAAPELLEVEAGGWLAPALLLFAGRRLGFLARPTADRASRAPGPPSREVRGTLSLRGVVGTQGELPSTSVIDLDLRAGQSMAVLCEDFSSAQTLAELLAGRQRPFAGEIMVDGTPVEPDDHLVAVVAPGEPFVVGGLDENIAVLREDEPDRATLGAARDACGLVQAARDLGGQPLDRDGDPLEPDQRLLVLAARVLVSHYRLLVVVDPGPWVDAARAERWRAAVVRASVGRTAVWITNDVDLAERADHVFEFEGGVLRRS